MIGRVNVSTCAFPFLMPAIHQCPVVQMQWGTIERQMIATCAVCKRATIVQRYEKKINEIV